MFCRYCGKEIPEGSVCDCQKQNLEQAAVEGQEAEAGVQQGAQAANTVNVSIDIGGLKDIFAVAVTRPVSVIDYALANAQKTPQFITGVIYLIIMFLLPVIEFNVLLGDYAKHFPVGKSAFLVLLAAVICRTVVAVLPFAASLGKKSIKDLFALVCAATALPCILRVILTVTLLIKWGPLIIIAAIIYGCICFVLDYEIIKTTTEKKNAALWIFVLAELLSGLVIYLICKGVVQDASNSLMSSLYMC